MKPQTLAVWLWILLILIVGVVSLCLVLIYLAWARGDIDWMLEWGSLAILLPVCGLPTVFKGFRRLKEHQARQK